MGGNIKAANTSEPKVERECSVCEDSFQDTVKYSAKQVCSSCKDDLGEPTNLESSITVDKYPDRESIKITVSLTSTVNDYIGIPIDTNSAMSTNIIGLLRVESEDGNIWYEDVWTTGHGYGDCKVTSGGWSTTFTWPVEEEVDGIREEYQKSMGDPFDAEQLTISFNFIDSELQDLTEEFNVPSFLVELE